MDNKTYWQFMGLCNQLSPENLTGDGEYSREYVAKRQASLNAQWKILETKIGRRVTVDEIELGYSKRNPLIRDDCGNSLN